MFITLSMFSRDPLILQNSADEKAYIRSISTFVSQNSDMSGSKHYLGVKSHTLFFVKSTRGEHIIISNRDPTSVLIYHYVQLDKRHSRRCLLNPCKIEKQIVT